MSATLAITSRVLTTEAVTITTQYWEMMPSEFINPTPAGRKNSPMFSVRSVESFFTLLGLTILNASARNNNTKPVDKITDKLSCKIEEEDVKCFY